MMSLKTNWEFADEWAKSQYWDQNKEIPLKERACILYVEDKEFIKQNGYFENIERIYFSDFRIKIPKWKNIDEVARDMAIDPLFAAAYHEGKPNYSFSPNKLEGWTYMHREIYREAKKLSNTLDIKVEVEVLNKIYLPF